MKQKYFCLILTPKLNELEEQFLNVKLCGIKSYAHVCIRGWISYNVRLLILEIPSRLFNPHNLRKIYPIFLKSKEVENLEAKVIMIFVLFDSMGIKITSRI